MVGLFGAPMLAFGVSLLGVPILPQITLIAGMVLTCFCGYKTGWRSEFRAMGFVAFTTFCGVFLMLAAQGAWLAAFGTKVEGTVTHEYSNLGSVGDTATYYATVELPDGRTFHMSGTPRWAEGEKVKIYLDPVANEDATAASQVDGDHGITRWMGLACGVIALGFVDWVRRGTKPDKKRRAAVERFADNLRSTVLPSLDQGPWTSRTEVPYGWFTAVNPEGAVLRFRLDDKARRATYMYAPTRSAAVDPRRSSSYNLSKQAGVVQLINGHLQEPSANALEG